MAQKLHDQYKYSYDNLKVLLGGWNAWHNANYPSAVETPAAAPAGGSPPTAIQIIITPGP